MLEWLPLLTLPVCAVASALVVGVIHRQTELEDGALLWRFIVGVFIAAGVLYETMQVPSVQLRVHPELRLQADIEADPIYKVLAYVGPEYAGRFRAVLVAEGATSATLPEARLQARSMLTALATNRLGFADQATRIAWGQVTVDTLRELQSRSGEQCYAAISGQALDRETLAHGFSAQNAAAFEAAALRVLGQSPGIGPGRQHSVDERPADFNAAMREYDGIQQELAQVFTPEVSTLLTKKRLPPSPPLSADTVCAARIWQLDAMLQRPKATAALLVDAALR